MGKVMHFGFETADRPCEHKDMSKDPKSRNQNNFHFVIYLQGGLGNQLFQLAFGDVLEKSGHHVTYSVSSFRSDSYGRSPYAQILFPDIKISEETENLPILNESDFEISDGNHIKLNINASSKKYLLKGYWQDKRYVGPEFLYKLKARLREIVGPSVADVADKIQSSQVLGLHFRRYDYKHHGIACDGYYIQCIHWMRQRSPEISQILVFSDEPNYTEYMMRKNRVSAQIVRGLNDLSEFFLLASCSRLILANSTFSLWAAYLSGSENVIYPDPWGLIEGSPKAETLSNRLWLGIDANIDGQSREINYQKKLSERRFQKDKEIFLEQASGFGENPTLVEAFYPDDAVTTTPFDAHYVYHTSWAARRLLANPTELHVDIGSDIRFVTIASAYQKIYFLDYRPANIELSNLICGHVDLRNLQFDSNSIESLSCMHVIEHIGLGRYGDPIDFDGDKKAFRELARVLKPGGLLYLVVPVGSPAIVFHAHRIYNPWSVSKMLDEFTLLEFSIINDSGRLIENCGFDVALRQKYGCGCFLFQKKGGLS